MDIYTQLGQRIKALREKTRFSQEMLSTKMKLSRSAISQIETGERKIAADELMELAKIFHCSMEELLNPGKIPEVVLAENKEKEPAKPSIRINVPQKNVEKFKQVFLYLLNKIGSKPNIGETVIYKLLYFIDFNFYEKYETQIIGATYQKNKYGPTPMEFIKIRDQMIKAGEIEVIESKYFNFPQTKYLPRITPDLSQLCANEVEVIDEVLNRLSDMSAKQISDYSHNDVPWMVTKDGEKIEYEAVFYRNAPYSVRIYDSDEDEQ